MRAPTTRSRGDQWGNALAETLVTLLAIAPFLAGVPLLGKQLDIKQKSYDAARYAAWERTVWRSDASSNRKSEDDISLEARDRTLGSPLAGVVAVQTLRTEGVTENPLWRDARRQRLLDYRNNALPVALAYSDRSSPIDVGYWLVPGLAYGNGLLGEVHSTLRLESLNLNRGAFAGATITVAARPILGERADGHVSLGERHAVHTDRGQLLHEAAGAILSDTWTANDESNLRRRVDDVTVDELIEQLELPGRPIALQAVGKGKLLYGEGQYGWNPDLRPRSTDLPSAYVERR